MVAPGLHPTQQTRPTESQAERCVYDALTAGLPLDWYAWHSLRVNADWAEGEGDFVIVDPDQGMLVVEVKGGSVEQRDGLWRQNSRPMKEGPRDQGHRYAGKLISRLRGMGVAVPPFGVVAWFPDTPVEDQPDQDDLRGKLLGQNHLAWCGEALPGFMESGIGSHVGPVDRRCIEALHTLWGETWTPRLSLGQRVRMDEADRLQLDRAQASLMEGLEQNQRLLVSGAVGTGKTLMACEAARRLAGQGQRVLLVCFTDGLAQWLAAHVEETAVTARAISRLATELVEHTGQALPDLSSADVWGDVMLAAADAARAQGESWDAVIIDEAQDFTSDHWLLIDALIGAGRLWAFQDPAQAFWPERQVEDSLFDSYFTLSQIYRCHPELMGVAEAVRAGEADDEAVAEAIEAGRLRVVSCPSESSVADKVANEVGKLRGDGLEPGEIAVISLRGLGARESVLHSPALAKHNPVRVEDEALEDHVVADTFLRFKGLERPVIVVTDLHLVTEELGLRMYIALTRALTAAIVVAPGEVLQGNPALSAAR